MKNEKTCTGDHSCHLCALAAAQTPIDEIKALVDAPRFICFNCGRAANNAKNLCSPQPLD